MGNPRRLSAACLLGRLGQFSLRGNCAFLKFAPHYSVPQIRIWGNMLLSGIRGPAVLPPPPDSVGDSLESYSHLESASPRQNPPDICCTTLDIKRSRRCLIGVPGPANLKIFESALFAVC